jgi:hypothetical protein
MICPGKITLGWRANFATELGKPAFTQAVGGGGFIFHCHVEASPCLGVLREYYDHHGEGCCNPRYFWVVNNRTCCFHKI